MLIRKLFSLFADATDFFSTDDSTTSEVYKKIAGKDKDGNLLCVPLMVANERDETRVYGVDGFSSHFGEVVSLIASPGQGKSRLASTIYNIMRDTDELYFQTSDAATSFTKGVWRISDGAKMVAASKDAIDILDVEGLQKENAVHYLLIAVIVLSKSIVLLSRERINKEAFGVLEIAFKMLKKLGIALKKPVIFIQANLDNEGRLIDGQANRMTREELIASVAKDIPIVEEFQVEFFRLREIPQLRVLLDCGMGPAQAQQVVDDATRLYESDVTDLLELLVSVHDPLASELRMHYLIKILEYLNHQNPDLVLEQNLEFFTKDLVRWLEANVLREREDIVQKHLAKPLGDSKTLEEFFEAPEEKMEERFFRYAESESPFLGETRDKTPYAQAARNVFQSSQYYMGVLQAVDAETGNRIGIMSYVQPSFEAKKQSEESLLMDVYSTLKSTFESNTSFDLLLDVLPKKPPPDCVSQIESKYPDVQDISNIISDRWEQVRTDTRNRKNSILSQSKWLQKVRTEGDLTCSRCNLEHLNCVGHKKCSNRRQVPTVLWYWVKDSSKHAICNGCEEVCLVLSIGCRECPTTLQAKPILPDW